MKKITLTLSGVIACLVMFAQKTPIGQQPDFGQVIESTTEVIPCIDFHITRPLSELAAENPVPDNFIHPKGLEESEDREMRKPNDYPFTVEKDGQAYGNDPQSMQTQMGTVPGKAPIMNFAGQTVTGFRPMDPSGAVSSTHYIQAINSTTFRVYNKTTGAVLATTTVGNLWTPATPNDGDPIIMYDKAADRWFISQFGQTGNRIYIAISTTNNPLGTYYTYTFTSPQFPDYLKFGVWQDGYYMTSNQAQRVFAFERTAMLAGTPTAKSLSVTFSPPQGSGFFVPMPGDASDGTLPPAGTPCPIFSYSDNGWGGGFFDRVNIYRMAVNWTPTTPTGTITAAGNVNTAAFDGSYDAGWNDISQPGTTQKLDGIGGIIMYRAQWKTWTGYNSVVLNWAVRISATQRSIKWCELRQDQTTGVWSMYQEGIYTPDAATRWMGGIAMDNNGAIALCYLKSDATSIYPGLYYTGRRPCDPLGTLPVTESVAIAGTGAQTGGVNRDGDYSQVTLDPDGVTFWCTSEYMGGASGANAARTRIFSFQLPTCGPAAPVANFTASNTTPCIGATVNFTDISTNTPTSWAWTFSPTSVTYVGGTNASSQNPQVQFSTVGPYTVTLVATNASGNDSEIKTSYIIPVTGGALPVVQNFEGATFPPTGWSIQNADAPSIAWGTAGAKGLERRPAAGNTGSTAGSAAIECFNYNTDTMQVDNLLSNPISLVGATAPRMTFKRSYKYYNDATNPNNYHDELRVFISTDCGATYGSAVYYKKGVQLATNGTINTTFTPAVAADWDMDTINLTSYVGQNIIVKFEVTNRYGNNFYLDDINIDNTAAPVASVTIASNDADNTICAGTSVIFTATPTNGGTAPTYQWQVNGTNVGTNSPTYTTTGLTNGQVVTCIMTSNLSGVTGSPDTSNPITMTVNNVPGTPTITTSSPDCVGQTISLNTPTVSGATYAWTGPSSFTSSTQNPTRPSATAAMAGTYSVTVTVNGCTSGFGTATVVVNTVPSAPTAGSNTPVCVGSTINLTSNTVASATYAWTGPSSFTSALEDPTRPSSTAAMAGTYSVTVTVNGCTSAFGTTTVVVNTVPSTPTVTTSSPDCTGQTISLNTPTVSGATYAWTGPGAFTSSTQNPTRPSATVAMAGTYSVTVTVNGCTSAAGTAAVVINTTPTAQAVTTTPTACAASTGTITLGTTTGGTAPYTYSVNGSGFTSTTSYSGFAAGTYPVIVQTANGCQFSTTATVSNSSGPTAQAASTVNSTCGNANGTINIGTTTGGLAPFTYSVNGSAFTTATSYTGLAAGTYPVIVQDANACQFSTTATVTNTAGPTAQATTTTSSTCGASNGSITVGATTGGTAGYTYSVNGSGFTGTTSYTGLAAGTYPVIVQDANGCTFSTTATVTNTGGPTAQATSTTNSTCGGSDGSLTIGVTTGGTAAYMYSVNGSAFTATTSYTGLAAGTYTVAVQDANGCTFTTTTTVSNTGTVPSTPTVSQTGLTLTSSSATGNQWYLDGVLIPGATNQNYTATVNGTYTVVVTTGGCSSAVSSPIVINSVGIDETGNPYFLNVYPNPNDGNFTVSFRTNDLSDYRLEIFNTLGQVVYREEIKGFTGRFSKEMSVVQYGQGIYTIGLTNSKNETVKKVIVY